MKDNQANEIDNAFREGLGNIPEAPPPKVWDGLRLGLIERRLLNVENQNYWLKIGSGILSAVIIVLLGLLFKGNATNVAVSPQSEKIVFRDKFLHDTVYVTKTEKVYVPIKQIVYVKQNQAEEAFKNELTLSPKTIANDKSVTTNQVRSEENIANENNVPSRNLIDVKNAELNGKLGRDDKNFGVNNRKNDAFGNKFLSEINQSNDKILADNSKENVKLSLNQLDFKNFDSLNVFVKLPSIYYQNRMIYRRIIKPDNTLSFKNPSIKLFYAPELALVSMITDGSLISETIGMEKNYRVYSYGANISFDVTDKWSVETGLNLSYSKFQTVNSIKKRPVIAEMYKGSPQYLYRTALGTAVIPTDQLNTKPVVGSTIIVEAENTHEIKQFRMPFLAKYKFYEGQKMFGAYTNRYSLYAVMGAELRYNRSQMLNAEIYEADGHDFYTTFTDFKDTKPFNMGLVFGSGFEYNLARKINFYVEPTIRLSPASYSQNTIVKSFPRWWSFAFGFQYNFK